MHPQSIARPSEPRFPSKETLQTGIAGSEWVVFEESSHMPHVEERERYMQVVGDWLARHD